MTKRDVVIPLSLLVVLSALCACGRAELGRPAPSGAALTVCNSYGTCGLAPDAATTPALAMARGDDSSFIDLADAVIGGAFGPRLDLEPAPARFAHLRSDEFGAELQLATESDANAVLWVYSGLPVESLLPAPGDEPVVFTPDSPEADVAICWQEPDLAGFDLHGSWASIEAVADGYDVVYLVEAGNDGLDSPALVQASFRLVDEP